MNIYCKNCGDWLQPDMTVCPSCGARTAKGKKALAAKLWFLIPLAAMAVVVLAVVFNLDSLRSLGKEPETVVYVPVSIVETEAIPETTAVPEMAGPEVLFEQDGVVISAFGVEETNAGLALKLEVENRSDRDIILSGDDFVVNGVTLAGSLFMKVGAGKTVHDSLDFYTTTLNTAGIQSIATIRAVDTTIKDPDSFETLGEVELEYVTELGRDFVQKIDESGTWLYGDPDFTVISKGLQTDLIGKKLLLLVKNTSNRDLYIEAMNLTVNGIPVGCLMFDRVCANTAAFCELTIFESDLEENGISNLSDVRELVFDLQTMIADTYDLATGLQDVTVTIR